MRPVLNIPILAEFLDDLRVSFADNLGAERGELFYADSPGLSGDKLGDRLSLSGVTGTLPKPERPFSIAAVCVQLWKHCFLYPFCPLHLAKTIF